MNAAKAFCDQPTQKVWYRDFEQPRFDASQEGQMLTVRTEQAIFHYNLRRKRMESITLRGGRTVTDFESGNLRGTARTLDQSTGSVPLTKGVISKDGVATLDDSASLLLLEDGRIRQEFTPEAAADLSLEKRKALGLRAVKREQLYELRPDMGLIKQKSTGWK